MKTLPHRFTPAQLRTIAQGTGAERYRDTFPRQTPGFPTFTFEMSVDEIDGFFTVYQNDRGPEEYRNKMPIAHYAELADAVLFAVDYQ